MAAVRMGEMVVSGTPTDELIALGLGSCIGLAIIDRTAGIAGLAHVVLPGSADMDGPAGKFADRAVPELVAQMCRVGAVERRFEVVIAGGARMFSLGNEMDIGSRNEAAVRDALGSRRITVRAAATGGNRGRTVRVAVGEGTVTVREAGGDTVTLLEPGRRAVASRAGGIVAAR